jgi:5-methylcytosine-specific restriction endonuclease McrA
LCLTSVIVLARVMTEANRHEVLPRFFGLSRQEAEQVAVEIRPVEVVPRRTVVTETPVSKPTAARPAEPKQTNVNEYSRSIVELASTRTLVEPLTPRETRIHVTVSPEFVALLKKAKAGQSHVQPGASDEQVLTAALELLVAQQEKRRSSVPPKVKREARKRDAGKCTWPLASGGTCGSEIRTEIDHVVPRGRGGPSTVDNCRVLCDVHNREAARQVYGDRHMELFTRRVPHASEPLAEWVPIPPPPMAQCPCS